jgi:hypothetical protein
MLKSRGLKPRPYFMSTKLIVIVTGLGGQTLAKLNYKVMAITRPDALGIRLELSEDSLNHAP